MLGTQHTVFGQLQDDASFRLLDQIWELPTKNQGGLTMLQEPIHFEMRIESGTSLA